MRQVNVFSNFSRNFFSLFLKIFVSSREAPKVINSYKIIEKTKDNGDKSFYILGKSDLVFPSLSEILKFYSSHYLNQSPLIKPVRI
jgi:hypothetical protein